jgi:YhcH/YjgK/YiaL family protein
MVVDHLRNYKIYQALSRRISVGLAYLFETDFTQLEVGKYPIEGEDVFAIINDYALKPESEGRLEGHREYIDIQYLARGGESIGYVPYRGQQMVSDYNDAGDYVFYSGSSSLVRLEERMFAIFYQEDLHMPGIGHPDETVRKVVVKVRK